jgi:hypothetical protein
MAEFSKEGCGSKWHVLPMMMIIFKNADPTPLRKHPVSLL